MKKITRVCLFVGFGLFLFGALGHAQQLIIPIGSQHPQAAETPSLGMPMSLVLETFGEPLKRNGAIGNPPIERWEYLNFSVYFESTTVIHSVVHFMPESPDKAKAEK
jgi:hypothetical protein